MIELIQWPPQRYCTFTIRKIEFNWDGPESFIIFKHDGTVDLSTQAEGFVNRIQRYGNQNKIPEEEWATEKIYNTVYSKLPFALRKKFFRITQSDSPQSIQMIMQNPSLRRHDAPVPEGLAEAAGFGHAVADEDLPQALAGLSPDSWLLVLNKWLHKDPLIRKGKKIAGPVWWYALHAVAKNPVNSMSPQRFLGKWLGIFPCRLCRIGTRVYMATHPAPGWATFEKWASDLHDYVTRRKG